MTPASREITQQSASQLAEHLASGELSAAEVVEAHIQRIEEVNPALNAVVVPLFEQARSAAREADAKQARGETLGPLHGVPVTIKDMFDVAGSPTSAGLKTRASHRATRDADAVERLKRAGAIVLGKTNIPQLGVLPDASNFLYGRTKNPWNVGRTPGGSSGGEAAIIAAGGSPLGIGSDGGGSIRQPCHSCGICGIKPTGDRLSFRGHWEAPNWRSDWVTAGPMARSVDDLWLALQALQDPENNTAPAPIADFRRVNVSKLRVGVYRRLGWWSVTPAIERAVEEAASALQARGAQVQPFDPPDVEEAWAIYFALFSFDAFKYLRGKARGNKLDWRVKRVLQLGLVPSFLRSLIALGYRAIGDRSTPEFLRAVRKRVLSPADIEEQLEAQDRYRKRFAAAIDSAGVDVLIGAPSVVAAVTPSEFFANYGLMYTGYFNLLTVPAGVVPVTRVRAGEACASRVRDSVDRSFARIEKGGEGLPIGIQVAARWWREDLVLAVMKELENHFRQTADYPHTPVDPFAVTST